MFFHSCSISINALLLWALSDRVQRWSRGQQSHQVVRQSVYHLAWLQQEALMLLLCGVKKSITQNVT